MLNRTIVKLVCWPKSSGVLLNQTIKAIDFSMLIVRCEKCGAWFWGIFYSVLCLCGAEHKMRHGGEGSRLEESQV
jgi:hypothetical protein